MSLVPHLVYAPLRAGSTLFRLMIDAHPALSCPGESDFLFEYLQNGADGWRYDVDALHHDRIFREHGIAFPEGRDGLDALDDMLRQIAREGKHPVLMVHRNMPKIAEVFPDARMVELRRDPRDVARSAIGMGWAGHAYFGAAPWIETFDSLEEARPTLRTEPISIRYEDLIAAPEDHLMRLCAQFGIDYHPVMLEYHKSSTYAEPDPSLVRQWRRKMTETDVRIVEARIGDRLTRYGYEPSGLPTIAIGPALKARLILQNKWATLRFRIGRFGFVNVASAILARRLGMTQWLRRTERRIQAIELQHLK